MATINISDLRPTGSELFSDSESYMSELGDSELDIVNGGSPTSPVCIAIVSAGVRSSQQCAIAIAASINSIGRLVNGK